MEVSFEPPDEPSPQPSSQSSFETSFQSWGRYPRLPAKVVPLYWTSEFPPAKQKDAPPSTGMLPVGLGRSYGDVCLLERGTLLIEQCVGQGASKHRFIIATMKGGTSSHVG